MKFLAILFFILLMDVAASSSISSGSVTRNTFQPRFGLYVQTFHTPGSTTNDLDLTELEGKGITHVMIASIHLNGDASIHLNDAPPDDPQFDNLWSNITSMQEQGIKVIGMVGGAAQGSFQALCDPANFDTYYNNLNSEVINKYSLDGLELNIEEDINDPSAACIVNVIQKLYSDHGENFIISLSPVASAMSNENELDPLSGIDYTTLDAAAVAPDDSSKKLVHFYNAQCYSGFGTADTTTSYDAIIGAGWEPARIVMSTLDSSSDGQGWVSVKSVLSTIGSLRVKYPSFAGVTGWEYFDAGTGDNLDPLEWVAEVAEALGW